MPCPNCLCQQCAKERAKPIDGWGRDGLYRSGIIVANIGWLESGWFYLDDYGKHGPYCNSTLARKAAERAWLSTI